MVSVMRKIVLASLVAALGLVSVCSSIPGIAYPARPESARVWYEIEYFPVRLISMVTCIVWDAPTGMFQDSIKGAIGGTRVVARNIGNENGTYELIVGGLTGGPVGLVAGGAYGILHGFAYGAHHGFVGYPSPNSGSHSMLFQGKSYVVPYDDNY